jgi:hypothetical protein
MVEGIAKTGAGNGAGFFFVQCRPNAASARPFGRSSLEMVVALRCR